MACVRLCYVLEAQKVSFLLNETICIGMWDLKQFNKLGSTVVTVRKSEQGGITASWHGEEVWTEERDPEGSLGLLIRRK